ncbi:NAD(P)/FAD-dependent oxidoreductase [Labrys monachus]|uniref:Sarcosine oxidase subunit beta n=1 Tax=Labrys monachus TaxID=217067 RepID=A0ABU0F7A1_9HYPH|nr:FAD-binding oxidoreductase [Labrys monachus]MDQ0390490.1 sarcosine oxidase subunit beta [Labrys monachus]
MRIVVIGSGVIGASIAYHLARAGAGVALVDRSGPAAMPSASWASAGGLRSQGRHAPEHAITKAAALRWTTLADELEADLEVSLGGHLHIAETAEEAAAVEARLAGDRAAGIAVARLEGAALRAAAPCLTPKAVLGAFSAGDGQAHPGRTAIAFAQAAARHGATCHFGQAARLRLVGDRATGVVLQDGGELDGDRVVLAAGAWSVAMLADLGLDLPLRWRGLQMLLSDVATPLLAPTVTAVGRNLSLKQSPSGQMMVGGRWFARPLGDRPAVEPIDAHVARQWSSAVAVVPAMARLKLAQVWAGVEAQTLDSLPLIGPAGPAGLYLATGFSNHGFQIAPEIGRLAAADMLERPQPVLEAFRVGRAMAGSDRAATFKAESCLL